MTRDRDALAAIAARHDLTPDGVETLAAALEAGRGAGAQWHHSDLGGMGQWLRGGLLQIGDMFNDGLKARVRGALEDLVRHGGSSTSHTTAHRHPALEAPPNAPWWPGDLGTPSATGAQNGMRYACFPATRRLAVAVDGRTTVYDTGDHRLTGFAQAQGQFMRLTFSGPDGSVTLDDLKPVT